MPDAAPRTIHHRLDVEARLGSLALDVELELGAPWTVLFGPSGSGKSSLLRAMCGLPIGDREAKIRLERLDANGQRLPIESLPPQHRDLAYAPQTPALLPQLSVGANVRFSFEVCSSPPLDSAIVDDALSLFRLHVLADRHPRELSGGEAQRVNLARAFATPGTRLMLLDEPFTGIDRALRDAILPEMRRVAAARNLPVVSVTHDVEEALRLEAEVVRMERGRVVAQGPAREVLAEEARRILEALQG